MLGTRRKKLGDSFRATLCGVVLIAVFNYILSGQDDIALSFRGWPPASLCSYDNLLGEVGLFIVKLLGFASNSHIEYETSNK